MIVTMQDYTITDRAPVLIGYEGENLSRNFTVKTFDDLSAIASIELLIGDVNCGAMTVNNTDDTEITISLDAFMIGRAGYKKAQLIMLDDTGAIVMKSNQFDVLVGASNNPRYYAAGEKVKTLTVSIDGRTRQIILPAGFAVSVNGDVAVDHIAFKAPASYGDFDFGAAACRVDWTGVDGTSHTNICVEKDADGNWIWALPTALTRGGEGEISFSVSYIVTDATTGAVTADWNTGLVKFYHLKSAKSDDVEEDVEEETTYDRLASAIAAVQSAQASVDDVNTILAGITSATPTVVETVADLNGLDTSKVKLAIVAADGYLYYYDGTAWKSGFAYGGLQEVIAARTDSDGVTHADLKTRLNTAEAQIKEDSSALVNVTEIDVKTKLTWEQGTLHAGAGTEIASGTRLRSKEFLDVSVYSSLNISIDSGYKYAIYAYGSERNFIPSLSYTDWRTSALTLPLPQNAKFIRFLMADTEDGTASVEYSEKITISGVYKIIAKLKNDSPNLNDYAGISLGWEIGSLQPRDGSELSSNSRVRSRKFFVGKGTRLGLTDALTYKHLLYMYSTDGNYISSGNWSNKDIIVEQDAVIRVLLAYSNNATISNVDDIIDKEIVSYSLPYTELLNSKTPAIYDIPENKKRKTEISVFKQKKTTSEAYGQCDLKMMFFTDVHGDALRTQRMTDLINNWGVSYFDVAVCGGDIVQNIISEDISWYYTATNDLNIPLLNAIGNHDARTNLNATLAPKTEVYEKFILPIVSKSAIIQPENAQANGYNYYYKDFGAVRVIVIDCMYWDSTQLSWLTEVLSDAKSNSKHVLCVSHAAFPLNSMQKVDCLWSKSGVNTDNVRTNLEAAEAVKTYIDNGGIFIAWLVGHQHGDYVHILNSYNNQIVINLASFAQRAGWLLKNTEKTEYNYDCLTYVAIDTTNSIIKLMRIGANIDIYGTQYKGLVVDYSNSNVVSSY